MARGDSRKPLCAHAGRERRDERRHRIHRRGREAILGRRVAKRAIEHGSPLIGGLGAERAQLGPVPRERAELGVDAGITRLDLGGQRPGALLPSPGEGAGALERLRAGCDEPGKNRSAVASSTVWIEPKW